MEHDKNNGRTRGVCELGEKFISPRTWSLSNCSTVLDNNSMTCFRPPVFPPPPPLPHPRPPAILHIMCWLERREWIYSLFLEQNSNKRWSPTAVREESETWFCFMSFIRQPSAQGLSLSPQTSVFTGQRGSRAKNNMFLVSILNACAPGGLILSVRWSMTLWSSSCHPSSS